MLNKTCLKFKLGFLRALIFMGAVVFCIKGIDAYAQEDKVVRGVVDIHSTISDGLQPLGNIAALVQEKGLSVLIFNDCALRKWEYGLWPLRNLIKKTYRENSVLRLGIDKYLKSFATLKKEFPDLVLIPGLETSPFFYWEGSPFSKNLALIDYYKQFLIIGLNPKDYRNLPIVGNRRFLHFSPKGLLGLWPMIIIIFGLRFLKKKTLRISFIVLGALFLLNNLPFPTSRFNVYHGNQGIEPYQDLIDYVNRKGGLIFWAHPEMLSQTTRYFGVETYTAPHLEDLFLTHDYAGFGVTLNIAEPGNIWDKILLEYIAGERKKPAWIIAPVHYIGPPTRLDSPETLFFVREAKQEDVLAALSQGKTYVRFNLGREPAVLLSEFGVRSVGSSSIQVLIKGNQVPSLEPLKIELIRNGQVFRIFEETRSEWMITVEDKLSAQEPKTYYRLRIKSPSSIILSNPIFAGVKN